VSGDRAITVSKNTKGLIVVAVLGWGFLALLYGFGVAVTFERGGGQMSDLVVPAIPLTALALAIGVPMLLSRAGWTRSAFAVAVFFVIAMLPVFGLTLVFTAR